MFSEVVNIQELTHNQPFCAGIILRRGGAVVATLNTDHLHEGLLEIPHWRVGAIGGGQEAGELIHECALREAQEEASVEVRLENAAVTYYQDMDTGELTTIRVADEPAPFLFQRLTNPRPSTPYKPGLPTGTYIYFALYLAQPYSDDIKPGDDVEGLLEVPLELWESLKEKPTLGEILAKGATLIENKPLAREQGLWLPEDESLTVIVDLLLNPSDIERYDRE